MRFVSDGASMRQYTEFLTRHERCHFQQSPEWARVKENWKQEVILAEDAQGNISGCLSVLIRKIPLCGNLMYSPRGPVCDTNDADSLRQLLEGAELLSMRYNAMALRMEPDVPASDEAFRTLLEDLGCRIRTPRSRGDLIQPRQVFRLDLRGKTEEDLLAGFHRKARYGIHLAQRRGVTVRVGAREDLPRFHALLTETGKRNGFLVRPLSYLERVWDELGPEHMTLLLAYCGSELVAGAIPIFYGRKTWYAFGAGNQRMRDTMAGYLLQWEMIRGALARGDQVYDLRGVLENPDPSNGLYLFKSRFGGELETFLGEVYVPYRPLAYRLYRLAERAFMAARDRYTTLRRRHTPDGTPPTPAPRPVPWNVPSADSSTHRSLTA